MNESMCIVNAHDLLTQVPRTDFHIHTNYSDGKNTISEYLCQARTIGIRQLAFSDHIRNESTWFPAFSEEIIHQRAQDRCMGLFRAVEAKITGSGKLDAPPEVIRRADAVIGVVHRYPRGEGYYEFKDLAPEAALRLDVESTNKLIDCNDVDIIGHLGGVYHKYFRGYPKDITLSLIRAIKEKKKILEINPRYISNLKEFLDICIDINPRISLGSDAHSITELGNARRAVLDALRERQTH